MFGGKTESRGGGGVLSIIAAGVSVKGDIATDGDLHIDGNVEGDIACGSIVQGADSRIAGTVKAKTARLAGTIEGTVDAPKLTIDRTARISGDVAYTELSIEAGAKVDGRMTHRTDGPEPALRLIDASA